MLPRTSVVRATAHLDHYPGNNDPRNLAALCQRCQFAHDRGDHCRQRSKTPFCLRSLSDPITGLNR